MALTLPVEEQSATSTRDSINQVVRARLPLTSRMSEDRRWSICGSLLFLPDQLRDPLNLGKRMLEEAS